MSDQPPTPSRPDPDRPDPDRPDPDHRVPAGVDRPTVEALGLLSEALETTERARGHLYSFHQLTGSADAQLQAAVQGLREAGHHGTADDLEQRLVGRNVLFGRWTYQVLEEYDDGYWSLFRELEGEARRSHAGGHRHLYEAHLKTQGRTTGEPGHESDPRGSG